MNDNLLKGLINDAFEQATLSFNQLSKLKGKQKAEFNVSKKSSENISHSNGNISTSNNIIHTNTDSYIIDEQESSDPK